uniref:UBX domain protein 10 n=1 Tax=Neogobius melanostomus TaxID=47308 RepID=A0A8C6WSK9_9GOBI
MEMHLTRPKSSKGRRRDGKTTNASFNNDAESFPRLNGGSPFLARPDTFHARSQPEMQHPSHGFSHEDQLPHGPSLNRFKVLPSIERGRPKTSPHGADTKMPSLGLTGLHISKAEGREGTDLSTGRVPSACSSSDERKAALSPDTLLLAIKDPGGRRFQQHFNHTDTLCRVRASAEAKFGAHYGENASIETMEVPRRSFTDMSRTLSQCGIVNKSVLCIFQPQDD